MNNKDEDNKPWSNSDRKNQIQHLCNQLLNAPNYSRRCIISAMVLGYMTAAFTEDCISPSERLASKFEKNPPEAFQYLLKIAEEFIVEEPKDQDEEFDLNELLESLKAELGEEDESPEPVSEEELDEFISKLEQESPPPAIPPPDLPTPDMKEHIKKNAKRYEDIYHSVCDFVIKNYDKELTAMDDYEEEASWKYADPSEVKREKKRLQAIIHSAADKKTRELLGDSIFEIQCFKRWLHGFNDDRGSHGSDWWATIE